MQVVHRFSGRLHPANLQSVAIAAPAPGRVAGQGGHHRTGKNCLERLQIFCQKRNRRGQINRRRDTPTCELRSAEAVGQMYVAVDKGGRNVAAVGIHAAEGIAGRCRGNLFDAAGPNDQRSLPVAHNMPADHRKGCGLFFLGGYTLVRQERGRHHQSTQGKT